MGIRRFVPTQKVRGFSLIETMIATAVFSFGLAGMASMMLSSVRGMSEAELESLASLHAGAMAAALQMSPAAMEHLANPPHTVPLCFESEECTAEEWLSSRYLLWQSQVSTDLPGGRGVACADGSPMDGTADQPSCDGAGPAVTKVFWTEARKAADESDGLRRAVAPVPQ